MAASGRVGLVHNGIIENHDDLRDELKAKGYSFVSQTDTEVIAHLVDHYYDGDLFEAVQRALPRLRGAYAIAVFCRDEPHRVVGARAGLAAGARRRRRRVRTRTSSLPMRWRWPASPTRSSISKKATSSTCSSASTGSSCRCRRRIQARRARRCAPSHAHTGAAELGPVSPLHAEGDLRAAAARSPTRSKRVAGISPELFGDGAYRVFKQRRRRC